MTVIRIDIPKIHIFHDDKGCDVIENLTVYPKGFTNAQVNEIYKEEAKERIVEYMELGVGWKSKKKEKEK